MTDTHPFSGEVQIIRSEVNGHFWVGPLFWVASRRRLFQIYVKSHRHGPSRGALLILRESQDNGNSWVDERVIYSSDLGEPRFPAARVFDGERIGILFTIQYEGKAAEYAFLVSDDLGVTWRLDHIQPPRGLNFYGEILQFPESGGGHDTQGFICFGYEPEGISYLATRDNGQNWHHGLALRNQPGQRLVEASVFPLEPGRWGLLARDAGSDQVTVRNAWGSVSRRLTDFPAAVDSGLQLGANPIVGVVKDETVYAYGCMRGTPRGSAEGYSSRIGFEDELVYAAVPVRAFVTQGGVFSNPEWVAAGGFGHRFTGYIFHTMIGGARWAVASAYEGPFTNGDEPGTMSIVLIAPRAPAVAAPALLSRQETNLFHNPDFGRWERGSAFALQAGVTADRWAWNGNGASLAKIERVAVPQYMQRLIASSPVNGLALDNRDRPARFSALEQTHPGTELAGRLRGRVVSVQAWLVGAVPQPLVFQARFEADMGRALGAVMNIVLTAKPSGDGLWFASGVGLIPVWDIQDTGPRAGLVFSFKGVPDMPFAAHFFAARLEVGDRPGPLKLTDRAADDAVCRSFFEKLQYSPDDVLCQMSAVGPARLEGMIPFGEKVVPPDMTIDGRGEALRLAWAGGVRAVPPPRIMSVTKGRARIRVDLESDIPGHGSLIAGGRGASVLVDTGW
jgi:hypothetical protein